MSRSKKSILSPSPPLRKIPPQLNIHLRNNSICSSPPLYYSSSNYNSIENMRSLEKIPIRTNLKEHEMEEKKETSSPTSADEIMQLHPQNSDGYDNWNNIDNWNKVENLRTLFSWITISALNIECLDEAIKRYRKFIAYGTILGLLFSTASGTISATRINNQSQVGNVNLILSALFTVLSFTIATYTGILKILQIQERLENFIKIKQEWILFSASISSELQLPIHLRKPVLGIISIYKNKFLDLLKIDSEVPEFIKNDIIERIKKKEEEKYKNEKWGDLKYSEASSLSDVIIEIGSRELKRLVSELDNSIQDVIMKTENSSNYGNTTKDFDEESVMNTHRTYESGDSIRKKIKTDEDEIKKLKREIENIYKQFSIISGGGGASAAAAVVVGGGVSNYDKRIPNLDLVSQKLDEDPTVATLCKQLLDRKYSSISVSGVCTPKNVSELEIENSDHTNKSSYGSNIMHNSDVILTELEKNSQTQNTPRALL